MCITQLVNRHQTHSKGVLKSELIVGQHKSLHVSSTPVNPHFWVESSHHIVAKKRDPGILDPEFFLAQIRKVEARLGKLRQVRKVHPNIRKVWGET